jgi:hypothetical protein
VASMDCNSRTFISLEQYLLLHSVNAMGEEGAALTAHSIASCAFID